jgi:murein DD-endopeptidase MepM/ murein hydrolase activator NlpD
MRRRLRRHAVVGIASGLLGLSAGVIWAAQPPAVAALPTPPVTLPGQPPSTITTTTGSTPPRGQATTTLPGQSSTTSTSTTSASSTTSTTVGPAGGDNAVVGVVPPADQAIVDSIRRTPPGSTRSLLAALTGLQALGMTPTAAAVLGFGRFPVAGAATWSDDWYEPRFNPDGSFRFHLGNDVVAACGLPVRAPADGVIEQGGDPGGGNTIEIVEPDASYLYLAHLAGYPQGQVSGLHVRVGQVIGFVGATGDATGCHLHLEIHPRGGPAIDPKLFLDAWAAEAVAAAPLEVAEARADRGLPARPGR